MNVSQNKFLIVKPSVRLTPHIIPVIVGLDEEFESAGLVAYVTSGQRSSGDQLKTIISYCHRYNIAQDYPEVLTCLPEDKEGGLYIWQPAWSKLLNIGVIINPPYPAKVLMDYWRNGVNKKGMIIGHSPHYPGLAFDIGGGIDHDITNELVVVKRAYEKTPRIPGFKGYLPERKNNCIHIDCHRVHV